MTSSIPFLSDHALVIPTQASDLYTLSVLLVHAAGLVGAVAHDEWDGAVAAEQSYDGLDLGGRHAQSAGNSGGELLHDGA